MPLDPKHALVCKGGMRIATWNINGAKARLEGALTWLKETNPDVACFQEIKSSTEAFPAPVFEELGYHLAVHGQKGFNGVAVLSKRRFDEVVVRGLPGDDSRCPRALHRGGGAERRRCRARRQPLSAQRQSDRNRPLRLQARLDAALRGAGARTAVAGGAVPAAG